MVGCVTYSTGRDGGVLVEGTGRVAGGEELGGGSLREDRHVDANLDAGSLERILELCIFGQPCVAHLY